MDLVKNALSVLLVAVIFTCLVSLFFLSYYFVHNMPESPQPELHRTCPLNVHGWIVYLTHAEKLLMDWLYYTLFGSIPLFILWGLAFGPGFKGRGE